MKESSKNSCILKIKTTTAYKSHKSFIKSDYLKNRPKYVQLFKPTNLEFLKSLYFLSMLDSS